MTTLSRSGRPLVIAHRGASGYRPEHTLAAYRLAIRLGADCIEPDLVCTRDGVLVARHENEISATTDVARRLEFARRRTTRVVDGRSMTGWFTEDFTLTELTSLRAVERLPGLRPGSASHDGRHRIATLDEILLLLSREAARSGRRVRLCVELKHATHFAALGHSLEETLLSTLRDHGLDRPGSGVLVESFEMAPLRRLRDRTALPLVQLVDARGAPPDCVATGDPTTYADLLAPGGLRALSRTVDGVSLAAGLVLPRDPVTDAVGSPSGLVDRAHLAGLAVLVWTLRDENRFLASNFRRGSDPRAHGDAVGQARAFLAAGVDGIFCDQPDTALRARAVVSPAG